MLAMEFLLRGGIQFKDPGVFVSFEGTPRDLAQNFASLGYDLNGMIARMNIQMLPMNGEEALREIRKK